MGENELTEKTRNPEERKRRIRRLKRLIVGTIFAAILIPIILCIVLGILLHKANGEIIDLETKYENLLQITESLKQQSVESATEESYPEEEVVISERSDPVQEEKEPEEEREYAHKVYLTFDDGPSIYTDDILDILKEYDVKATFFVVGKFTDQDKESYKRIVEEGHTLGIHSYSHKYSEIYQSMESFQKDVTDLQEYLYETTGVWCRYYRFPGGSSNNASKVDMKLLIQDILDQDMSYFDWNVSSGDAQSTHLSKDQIVWNSTSGLANFNTAIILMHDASDKRSTVEALPEIIEKIQAMEDTVILPIDENTTPVRHLTIQ